MSKEERIAEILRAWLERHIRGEEPDLEEFLAQHADLAGELRPRLEALAEFHQSLPRGGQLPERHPETIGEYRILREIGRGGMGIVYEAEQPSMGRKVALKLLAPVFTESAQAIKRFQREAKAAGRLHHTSIVQAHTMGNHEGYWYYTMEYVEGGSLGRMIEELRSFGRDAMARGARRHYLRVAEMFAGVADALDAAHKAGIIHRDIKPGNLLLDTEGTLKIVDFGMARLDEAPSLTLSGEVLGTPVYMSPEQAQAKLSDIDHRTDIYSLGATLYEVLTLRPPFKGKSALDIRSQIIARDPPPPRKVDHRIPRDLATIATKAMEKVRTARYQTAKEMARDLARFVEGVPIHARPVGPVGRAWRRVKRNKVQSALVAVIILLALAGGFFADRAAREAEQKRNAEYGRLLIFGQDAFGYSMAGVTDSEWHSRMMCNKRARAYFNQAIERMPERPEAYWLRALAPGGTLEEKLADLEKAEGLGLAPGTVRWLHACLLVAEKIHVSPEAETAIKVAFSFEPVEAPDLYAKARILSKMGKRKEAIMMLDRAIEEIENRAVEESEFNNAIRYLAIRHRAWLLSNESDLDDALRDLQLIVRYKSPAVNIHIASIKRRMGETEEAEKYFEKTMREAETIDEWYAMCRACCLDEEYGWLDSASKKAVQSYPSAPEILNWRADAYNHKGKPEEALDACNQILAMDSKDLFALSSKALALMELERYDEAIDAYRPMLALVPEDPWIYRDFGILYDKKGDLKEAITWFKKALDNSLYDTYTMNLLGSALYRHGEYEEAIGILRGAVEIDREYVDPHLNLGLAYEKMEEWEQAKEQYNAVLAIEPDYTGARLNLGNVYHNEWRDDPEDNRTALDEAVKIFEELIEKNPEDARPYFNLGNALFDQGNTVEARGRFTEANSIQEDADSYDGIGRTFLVAHELDEAVAHFKKALAIDSKHVNANYNLAVAYHWMGRPEMSLDQAQVVRELLPPDEMSNILHLIGDLQMRLGRLPEAEESLTEAIAFNNASVSPRFILANIRLSLGRTKKAIECFEQIINRDENNFYTLIDLSYALRADGQFEAARSRINAACRLARQESREVPEDLLDECARMVELDTLLPEFLEGRFEPEDPGDQALLALVCMARDLPAAAARHWRAALGARPDLGDDTWCAYWLKAARAAALASEGKGRDGAELDDTERAVWREQSLAWLRIHLAQCENAALKKNSFTYYTLKRSLGVLKLHPDLQGLRDPVAVAALPDSEREEFVAFWEKVDALLVHTD